MPRSGPACRAALPAGRGPGAPAAGDHRRGRRPAADGQRGRARCGSSSTARSTTSPPCAAGWKAADIVSRRQSDTETLVHLYEDEGPECLGLLDGMFAFALWDAERRQLLLARDRLGKKPLVYRHEPGRLLFASQLKSLLEVPGVPRQIDPQALDEYLTYQYVPHPRTIWQGIRKLPPGHLAVYRDRPAGSPAATGSPISACEEDLPPRRVRRAVARAAHRGGRSPLAKRSAAGGVSLRRRRFDDHRRA